MARHQFRRSSVVALLLTSEGGRPSATGSLSGTPAVEDLADALGLPMEYRGVVVAHRDPGRKLYLGG